MNGAVVPRQRRGATARPRLKGWKGVSLIVAGSDFYSILEVVPAAGSRDITRAYRRLLRAYHPDLQPEGQSDGERAAAARALQAVMRAYAVLGDADRRAAYDRRSVTPVRPRPVYDGGWLASDVVVLDPDVVPDGRRSVREPDIFVYPVRGPRTDRDPMTLLWELLARW